MLRASEFRVPVLLYIAESWLPPLKFKFELLDRETHRTRPSFKLNTQYIHNIIHHFATLICMYEPVFSIPITVNSQRA